MGKLEITLFSIALAAAMCGVVSGARAQTATLRIEQLPTIAPGIEQAPAGHEFYAPRMRHSVRARAGVLRIRGDVPPNGCEATQGGGFRILSGIDRDACVGQP